MTIQCIDCYKFNFCLDEKQNDLEYCESYGPIKVREDEKWI